MALSLKQAQSLAPVAAYLGVELAALVAVVEVESAGQIFAPSSVGENMPVIRWEGHYFYKLLKGGTRTTAVAAGLAAPKAGEVKNPASQDGRYRILAKATAIDEEAAYSSISIGVGQVMGSHYAKLGYASARAMFSAAKKGLVGQVEIMAAYIEEFGLADELRRRDWSAFARGYNGPAYAKNAYDKKMKAAYERALKLSGTKAATIGSGASTMLRIGSSGEGLLHAVQDVLRRPYEPHRPRVEELNGTVRELRMVEAVREHVGSPGLGHVSELTALDQLLGDLSRVGVDFGRSL